MNSKAHFWKWKGLNDCLKALFSCSRNYYETLRGGTPNNFPFQWKGKVISAFPKTFSVSDMWLKWRGEGSCHFDLTCRCKYYGRHSPCGKDIFALESSKILYSRSYLSVTIFILDFDLTSVSYQDNSAKINEVELYLNYCSIWECRMRLIDSLLDVLCVLGKEECCLICICNCWTQNPGWAWRERERLAKNSN